MPRAKKKTKTFKVLSRNSYRGRIMGTLPAFENGRCKELTRAEQFHVKQVHKAISDLLALMETK